MFFQTYIAIQKISTNVGFQPVKFVSFALSNYEIVVCSLLTLCLLVCVFNFLVFKYGARCVLLLPEEVRPMQRTKRR